jgi:chromosome segregation ATPase
MRDQKKSSCSTASADPGLQNQGTRGSTESSSQPVDELIARFQLETEKAIAQVRADFTALHQELSTRVATLQDKVTEMTETMRRQERTLEDAVHHTRKGVEECNLALKEAGKQAKDAAESAAVFAKLKDSQPDFAAQVRALETRLAQVRDDNTFLNEQVNGLTKRLDEFEVVAESIEETAGEVRGLDLGLKKLDMQVRTGKAI